MAKNVFDTLEERGYFSQATHRDEIYDLLSKPGVSFYIGFDPTADSLHVGHFVQLIVAEFSSLVVLVIFHVYFSFRFSFINRR